MKRIYNGFTTESQRTNDGPSFANRLPPYGGSPMLIISEYVSGRGERPWSLFPFHTAKLQHFSQMPQLTTEKYMSDSKKMHFVLVTY